MLLHVCLLFLLHVDTVNPNFTRSYSTSKYHTALPSPANVQLLVTPDFPVAAGRRVDMSCTASNVHVVTGWVWKIYDDNGTWITVGSSRDLTLTEPEQSGVYICSAVNQRGIVSSPQHRVFIVSIHATASDNVGVAGFVLSLLGLIIDIAVVFWLVWQHLYSPVTVPQTSTTGPSLKPEKIPKEGLQQDEADGDVYINYTSSNQAYSDLDPNNMTEDNLYSSLS